MRAHCPSCGREVEADGRSYRLFASAEEVEEALTPKPGEHNGGICPHCGEMWAKLEDGTIVAIDV